LLFHVYAALLKAQFSYLTASRPRTNSRRTNDTTSCWCC